MLVLKLRALPTKGYELMNGWYFGSDQYPKDKHFSLESFSRHIRSGRLDITTRSQYIGLTDVVATEIFENDIIQSFDSEGFEILHLIEYNIPSARFVARYNNDDNGFCGITEEWIKKFQKKVIGNKFEDPQLFNKGRE